MLLILRFVQQCVCQLLAPLRGWTVARLTQLWHFLFAYSYLPSAQTRQDAELLALRCAVADLCKKVGMQTTHESPTQVPPPSPPVPQSDTLIGLTADHQASLLSLQGEVGELRRAQHKLGSAIENMQVYVGHEAEPRVRNALRRDGRVSADEAQPCVIREAADFVRLARQLGLQQHLVFPKWADALFAEVC